MTVHLCSTVPFGEGPRSAADSFGLVARDDATCASTTPRCCPTAPGVNPQGSVMAIAIRNARRFVETTKRRRS